jgi:hypothetical protein
MASCSSGVGGEGPSSGELAARQPSAAAMNSQKLQASTSRGESPIALPAP